LKILVEARREFLLEGGNDASTENFSEVVLPGAARGGEAAGWRCLLSAR